MKVVLDEGVPRAIAKSLAAAGGEVVSFPNEWKGTKNGSLLALIRAAGFDCLLTCDKNLQHQQDIASSGIAVVVLPTQALWKLQQHVAEIAGALRRARSGQVVTVSFDQEGR